MTRRLSARQRRVEAWKVMRVLKTFTADDVMGGCDITYESAHALIRKLEAAEVIEKVHDDEDLDARGRVRRVDGSYNETRYRVIWDRAKMPPDVDSTHYWQQQAWTAMRVKARFTASHLVPAMEEGIVSDRQLRRWCKALVDAGYLRIHGQEGASHEYVYQLVRHNGPEPPVIRADEGAREVVS